MCSIYSASGAQKKKKFLHRLLIPFIDLFQVSKYDILCNLSRQGASFQAAGGQRLQCSMRSHIVSYCFLLDIAYLEFSDTDGELDDCDEDNRVVEGDKKNILVIEQNYVKFNYMVSQFLFLPLFQKENPFFFYGFQNPSEYEIIREDFLP